MPADGVRYVVSACLAGKNCRYDGGSNPCAAVIRLVEAGRAVTACPEGLARLPIPRQPCEQKNGRVLSRDGQDMTAAFAEGARLALDVAVAHHCRVAILKSRSPSCGLGRIYDGSFSRTLCAGHGLWAALLLQAGIACYSEENLPSELLQESESI